MCSPLAALSPAAALIKDKPKLGMALMSPAAAMMMKDKRNPTDAPAGGM